MVITSSQSQRQGPFKDASPPPLADKTSQAKPIAFDHPIESSDDDNSSSESEEDPDGFVPANLKRSNTTQEAVAQIGQSEKTYYVYEWIATVVSALEIDMDAEMEAEMEAAFAGDATAVADAKAAGDDMGDLFGEDNANGEPPKTVSKTAEGHKQVTLKLLATVNNLTGANRIAANHLIVLSGGEAETRSGVESLLADIERSGGMFTVDAEDDEHEGKKTSVFVSVEVLSS